MSSAAPSSVLLALAVGLVALSLALVAYGLAAGPTPASRAYERYVAHLDTSFRLLFMPRRGRLVARAQLTFVVALLLASAATDVPYTAAWIVVAMAAPTVYLAHRRAQRLEALEEQVDGFVLALANALKTVPSPAAALEATAALYRRNLWATSRWRVEVWAESDSIAGTIFDITARWDVPLMVTRGQSSETFAHNAAEAWKETSSVPSVLYIGDHDPAGLDIEESVRTKLETFYGRTLLWDRVGVTWSQAEALDLPGTPLKTAGRRKPYPFPLAVQAEALPAPLLRELLDDAIAWHVDQDELDVLLAAEESEREILHRMAGAVS